MSGGPSLSICFRLRVALGLILGLRIHDLRAAKSFMGLVFAADRYPVKLAKFVRWTLYQMWIDIPWAMLSATFDCPMSRTPIWLAISNPHANCPWSTFPNATLPTDADTVVVGAGFTGAAAAYHWSKRAPGHRRLVILEMDDPAAGSSGRNEGAVVMGRHFTLVRNTVRLDLARVRRDLSPADRERLARKFAAAYCRAAYRSSELIAEAIENEGFDCEYSRSGWVQAREPEDQGALDESVQLAAESGFADWTKISADGIRLKTGMKVSQPGAFSEGCAFWHPAKWVWCLLTAARRMPTVELFTRTRVKSVLDRGEYYEVSTSRGNICARHIINATESYTASLYPHLRPSFQVLQTQAASGFGGPAAMVPNVVISGTKAFWGRHHDRTLFGSDYTAVPHDAAGQNKPSRFISKFFLGHMRRLYGPYTMRVTHEWSGTVAAFPDGYPVVGTMDGKRQYLIAGMVGSGSNVSFNAARCVVCRVLGLDEPDDYPPEFFSPTRVLNPETHVWSDLS